MSLSLKIKNIAYHSNYDIQKVGTKHIRIAKGNLILNQMDNQHKLKILQNTSIQKTLQFTLKENTDESLVFQIFDSHTFGFNKQELLGVLKGSIKIPASNIRNQNSNYQVEDLNGKKVGKLELQLNYIPEAGVRDKLNKTRQAIVNPQQQLLKNHKSSIITVFSVISSLNNFKSNQNCYVSLKIGEKTKTSTTIKKKDNEPIWAQTLALVRQTEQLMEISLNFISPDESRLTTIKGNVNLQQLKKRKHIHSYKVELVSQQGDPVGICFLDIKTKEKRLSFKKNHGASRFDIIPVIEHAFQKSQLKSTSSVVQSRLSVHSKLKKHGSSSSAIRNISRNSVLLPNQRIAISKSERFLANLKGKSPVNSYLSPFALNTSDFNLKRKKHGNIGYGDKTDFTKFTRQNPGVGKYKLPSIFDRYI